MIYTSAADCKNVAALLSVLPKNEDRVAPGVPGQDWSLLSSQESRSVLCHILFLSKENNLEVVKKQNKKHLNHKALATAQLFHDLE